MTSIRRASRQPTERAAVTVEGFLAALEQIGLVRAVRTSFFAYPLINAAHILSIGALVTSVILMDLRLLGRFASLPELPFIRLFRRIALSAFAIAALTGVTLFAVRAGDYAEIRLFWVKMGLLLLAAANFGFFMAVDRRQTENAPHSNAWRASLRLSLLVWPAILIAGRFLGFV